MENNPDGFLSDNQDKFILRMPDGLRATIKARAAVNGRSMNAEILHTLLPHYGAQAAPVTATLSVASRLAMLEERLNGLECGVESYNAPGAKP